MQNDLKASLKKKQLLVQFYNKCHDPETGRFCGEETGIPAKEREVLKKLDPSIKGPVEEMLAERREVEPEYTELFENTAAEQGGKMEGLKHKFKDAQGIVGKIDRKVQKKGIKPEEAALDIVDSLRYTMSFPADNYTDGVKTTVKALREKGIEFESFDNNWQRGDAYNGINAVFLDTDTGLKIELQFHTPESFEAKTTLNHDDYEFVREGKGTSAQRLIAHTRMTQRSDAVPFPKNIDQLSGEIEGVKVNDIFRPSLDTLFTKTREQLLQF